MKYLIASLTVLLLLITAYLVFKSGTEAARRPRVEISAGNPFSSAKPLELPFDTSAADYARKLFEDGRYHDAAAAYGAMFPASSSPKAKAGHVLMAAQALVQADDAESRRYARELYETYVEKFSSEGHLDSVHYNLGLIAAADGSAAAALLEFTSLLQEYPESQHASNAAFFSRELAAVLERRDESLKGKILRVAGPALPSNPAALAGFLTSMASIIVWFVYDWKGHYEKLILKKDPLVWTLLVMFVSLAVTNYVFENRGGAKFMLDATKALGALKR